MDRASLRTLCKVFTYVDKVGYEPVIAAIERLFNPKEPLTLDEEIHAQIDKHAKNGGSMVKITLVRVVRDMTGMSLLDAKLWVEKHYKFVMPGSYEMLRNES
jgi:ribosomal protein L7/L12